MQKYWRSVYISTAPPLSDSLRFTLSFQERSGIALLVPVERVTSGECVVVASCGQVIVLISEKTDLST